MCLSGTTQVGANVQDRANVADLAVDFLPGGEMDLGQG